MVITSHLNHCYFVLNLDCLKCKTLQERFFHVVLTLTLTTKTNRILEKKEDIEEKWKEAQEKREIEKKIKKEVRKKEELTKKIALVGLNKWSRRWYRVT